MLTQRDKNNNKIIARTILSKAIFDQTFRPSRLTKKGNMMGVRNTGFHFPPKNFFRAKVSGLKNLFKARCLVGTCDRKL